MKTAGPRDKGAWLALLGPDGSGKSAVIDGVEELLAASFSGTRRYHLRPRVFRRGDGVAVTEPYNQSPRGTAASLSKLGVWWLDYWAGYLLRIRPALRRSGLVLFDRYFHDLGVDPRRYRYAAPRALAQRLARMVPQPHLIVILDAPVEVLQARKREVTPEETERQLEAYRRLARELPHAVVVDASRPLAEVVAEVASLIMAPGRTSAPCPA